MVKNYFIKYLSNNQLIGEIPSEVGTLTNLRSLHLQNNQLTGEIPYELGVLTNLIHLRLENNQFSGEIPPEIGNLDLIWTDSPGNWTTSSIFNNYLCPPYPDFIEEYVGVQDTSNCP